MCSDETRVGGFDGVAKIGIDGFEAIKQGVVKGTTIVSEKASPMLERG